MQFLLSGQGIIIFISSVDDPDYDPNPDYDPDRTYFHENFTRGVSRAEEHFIKFGPDLQSLKYYLVSHMLTLVRLRIYVYFSNTLFILISTRGNN